MKVNGQNGSNGSWLAVQECMEYLSQQVNTNSANLKPYELKLLAKPWPARLRLFFGQEAGRNGGEAEEYRISKNKHFIQEEVSRLSKNIKQPKPVREQCFGPGTEEEMAQFTLEITASQFDDPNFADRVNFRERNPTESERQKIL